MNADEDNHNLQRVFQELKEQDARHTPAFSRTWNAAASRRPVPRLLPWTRLAAAAVLLMLGTCVAIVQVRTRTPGAETPDCSALSGWQASTDGLLALPSTPWGSRVKVPSDSWIETDSSKSEAQD